MAYNKTLKPNKDHSTAVLILAKTVWLLSNKALRFANSSSSTIIKIWLLGIEKKSGISGSVLVIGKVNYLLIDRVFNFSFLEFWEMPRQIRGNLKQL